MMQATQARQWRPPVGALDLPTKRRRSKMLSAEQTGPRRWGHNAQRTSRKDCVDACFLPPLGPRSRLHPRTPRESLGARQPRHLGPEPKQAVRWRLGGPLKLANCRFLSLFPPLQTL